MKKLPRTLSETISEFRWPKKGDRLLRQSDDWNRGVSFAKHPVSRHGLQWDGYMKAGAGLIQLCTTEGYEHERITVIYPILFNYRHGLELAMKWIVLHYGERTIKNDHNLWDLWKICKGIIQKHNASTRDGAIVAVEQVVKDFHDLDARSTTFRYGSDNNNRVIELPKHLIDLDNTRDVMEGVSNFFNGLDGLLSDQRDSAPTEY